MASHPSAMIASNLGTQYRPAHDDNLVSDARLGAIAGGICRASGENSSAGELAVKAFDHSRKTKWLNHDGASEKAPAWLEYRLLPQISGPVVLGSYTVISADDHPERDPVEWVVEGLAAIDETDSSAEDMWQILDIQSGLNFAKRGQKLLFEVALHCPCYRWRLRITATREASSKVQLACWELWQAQLGHGNRCSSYLPLRSSLASKLEPPQPGLAPVSSCTWRSSNPLSVCPLSSACGDKEDWQQPVSVDENFPAWVELRIADQLGPVTLAAYTIRASSAQDREEDPCWWVLEGIPADTVPTLPPHSGCHTCSYPSWNRLHEVIGLDFDGPASAHSFPIGHSLPCWRFRLRCMNPRELQKGLKLGGIALYARLEQAPAALPQLEATSSPWTLAQDTRIPKPLLEQGRLVGGICRASAQHYQVGEAAIRAFDGDPKTKWLEPNGASEGKPAWVEYALLPGTSTVRLASYSVTSANDHPERDPSSWVLEGLPYSGPVTPPDAVQWVALDVQGSVQFTKRYQKESFPVIPELDCTSFRLRITSTAQPNCRMVQLACLDLFAQDPSTVPM